MTTPRTRIAERMRQIKQAKNIAASLRVQRGKNIAARYLQARGWSLEATLHILGYAPRLPMQRAPSMDNPGTWVPEPMHPYN